MVYVTEIVNSITIHRGVIVISMGYLGLNRGIWDLPAVFRISVGIRDFESKYIYIFIVDCSRYISMTLKVEQATA